MFPCCSTREALSIDVPITNIGLISTKPGRILWVQTKFNLHFFLIELFGFQCWSTREHPSIDISITNVGLISTKPGRFHFSGYGQNSILSISNIFEKNNLGFNAVVAIRKDISTVVSITNVGLISTKPGRFLFFGYGQNSISKFFEKNSTFWVSIL